MATRKRFLFAGVATVFGAGFLLGSTVQGTQDAQAQSATRVFELRTYTAPEGKLPNLQAPVPRSHHAHLRESWNDEHRLLDAPGRTELVEHAGLHHRPR